ncbi:McrB family protein [Flagellimonas oceanensis]|uniref:McrB family protein n=1 Tax=Flagellimonas oceanensis TaxID=2499163 RepID=UPI000F8EF38C|nr:AAA family ATPase [Allomuricauda oceanensis]
MTFHETILSKLLAYRENHPHFNFLMRQRAGAGQRFESGHWFQGNDGYAFVGLINASGGSNRTRSVGISISPTAKGYSCYLEIVFNEEKDKELIACYEGLAKKIQGIKSVGDTKYNVRIGDLTDNDFSKLYTFLDKNYGLLLDEFKNRGKLSVLVTDKKFEQLLKRINEYRFSNEPNTRQITMQYKALNTILYGPPGTGKTYTTKELAVQITNPEFSIAKDLDNGQKRRLILKEYDRLCEAGQIVFTTFHQSFGYEDFVEGIKPVTTADQKLIYDIKPGIFKKVCKKAEDNYLDFKKGEANEMAFDDAFEKLQEEWEENEEIKFPLKREGYDFTIIGFTEKSIQFKKSSGGTDHTLSISTLRDAYYGTREINETGVGIYYPSILKRLKSYESENNSSKKSFKNYVLIIDEINRGNVSSIFGELITLLEPDKRLGADEEILLKLPYSKDETFGVPPNLYIVGTMNTADRSVEALDTALRRRFIFKEVMPKPQLLEKITYNGFNLKEVLETINDRIEALLDRDHTIGHSYFIKLKSGDVDGLSRVFKNNIIPLLQEYFYNDYEKIALVLGEGFVKEKGTGKVNFAQFKNIDVPEMDTTYILLPQIDDIEAVVGRLLNTSNE